MFLVNSRLSRFTAALSPPMQAREATRAPLLPKVRGQFAEFLDRGSLVHLGGSPPAYLCRCAVRAVTGVWLAAFLGDLGVHDFRLPAEARASGHAVTRHGFACVSRSRLATGPVHSTGSRSLSRPRFTRNDARWCRNFLPACHRLRLNVLGLGPDSPWDD